VAGSNFGGVRILILPARLKRALDPHLPYFWFTPSLSIITYFTKFISAIRVIERLNASTSYSKISYKISLAEDL